MEPYRVHTPTSAQVPIVISVPHCGTNIPADLVQQFVPSLLRTMDDTDWFVDQLYNFAPEIGVTMITSRISRWVIDLNRDPQNKPLYSDGRIITGLCPVTDFLGKDLYVDGRDSVAPEEVRRRLNLYFEPYHSKLNALLHDTRQKFGKVLLWDCHSIRQTVVTIQQEKFPDLILGSADNTSASPELIDRALKALGHTSYQVSHNHPFKGGYITRNYGRPHEHMNALQLEMTKLNYMDDGEVRYDAGRAERMRQVLRRTLLELAESILS